MTVPVTHVDNAQRLDSDAFVDLYELDMYPFPSAGALFFCGTNNVVWQGNTYVFWGLQLTGDGANSDGQTIRPQLSIANFSVGVDGVPIHGIFSALHAAKKVEGGTFIRKRVLKTNVDSNTNIFEQSTWRVSRVVTIRPELITLEMRNTLDAPRFQIPAREFIPPQFPQVSLG